jgi:thiamine-phosphate pyrophosphorylase
MNGRAKTDDSRSSVDVRRYPGSGGAVRPVICMVSDGAARGDLVARVRAAAHAGVDLIQVREPDLSAMAYVDLVGACLAAVRGTRTRVLVNDRLDVAMAAGAHGVHLRSDSVAAVRARSVAPYGFLIGRSIHAIGDIASSSVEGVDYFIFGTVFPSSSKPGRIAAGLRSLAEVTLGTAVPVLAIGGITAERVADVRRAGAAGIAAISIFDRTPLDGMPALVRSLHGGVP